MAKFTTDSDCIKQREYVGIPAWHAAGYTGKGQVIFCDDVGGNHADCVADILQTILPDSIVYTGSLGYSSKNGVISSCNITCRELGITLPFDEFVSKYKVTMLNNSKTGGKGTEVMPIAIYMQQKIKQYNLIVTGSAGNLNGKPTDQSLNGACMVVSSVTLNGGKPKTGNDCIGPNIDFTMFTGFQAGTSFASPFLLGMAGLLRSKNPVITQDEVYGYFRDHCQDLGQPGKDDIYGWGLPILGEPNEYTEEDTGMIKQMLLTPNPYSRPGTKLQQVKAVAVHYVGNPGSSALANRNYFENLKNTHATKASSHYIIGLQGEILQLITEDEWSYCTNDRNKDTISIECCHPDAGGKFNAATYASLVDLCVDICKRHKLDPLAGGLIRHYDVTGKVCPKYFVDFPAEWEKFKKEVKEKMEERKVHWGEAYLDKLQQYGIIDSPEKHRDGMDGTFTKAETCAIECRLYERLIEKLYEKGGK